MIKFLLVLLLILSGCGKGFEPPADPRPSHLVDSQLLPYIKIFEYEYGQQVTNLPTYFGALTLPTVGECTVWAEGFYTWKTITISNNYWTVINQTQRIQLVMHELGHCILNRDHVIGNNGPNGCPTSIMRSMAFNSTNESDCLNTYWNYYIDELFNRLPVSKKSTNKGNNATYSDNPKSYTL